MWTTTFRFSLEMIAVGYGRERYQVCRRLGAASMSLSGYVNGVILRVEEDACGER